MLEVNGRETIKARDIQPDTSQMNEGIFLPRRSVYDLNARVSINVRPSIYDGRSGS
jgi:hypothetical protein